MKLKQDILILKNEKAMEINQIRGSLTPADISEFIEATLNIGIEACTGYTEFAFYKKLNSKERKELLAVKNKVSDLSLKITRVLFSKHISSTLPALSVEECANFKMSDLIEIYHKTKRITYLVSDIEEFIKQRKDFYIKNPEQNVILY